MRNWQINRFGEWKYHSSSGIHRQYHVHIWREKQWVWEASHKVDNCHHVIGRGHSTNVELAAQEAEKSIRTHAATLQVDQDLPESMGGEVVLKPGDVILVRGISRTYREVVDHCAHDLGTVYARCTGIRDPRLHGGAWPISQVIAVKIDGQMRPVKYDEDTSKFWWIDNDLPESTTSLNWKEDPDGAWSARLGTKYEAAIRKKSDKWVWDVTYNLGMFSCEQCGYGAEDTIEQAKMKAADTIRGEISSRRSVSQDLPESAPEWVDMTITSLNVDADGKYLGFYRGEFTWPRNIGNLIIKVPSITFDGDIWVEGDIVADGDVNVADNEISAGGNILVKGDIVAGGIIANGNVWANGKIVVDGGNISVGKGGSVRSPHITALRVYTNYDRHDVVDGQIVRRSGARTGQKSRGQDLPESLADRLLG
jgi:hypothetical protein